MADTRAQAQQLNKLFAGQDKAYGTYTIDPLDISTTGKVQGKAGIERKPVTDELWASHLEGKQGIGIIPIRDNNSCNFGAIDIDVYTGFDLAALTKLIEKFKLPLVVCRSKSGGAHVYLFTNEPVPAKLIQKQLRNFAGYLGVSTLDGKAVEIFPKQIEVDPERGDLGNYINMPYQAGDNTARYGFDNTGESLDIDEFIEYAQSRRISGMELAKLQPHIEETELDQKYRVVFEQGPTGLDTIHKVGINQGDRNNLLYEVAKLFKLYFGENYKSDLIKYNEEYVDPPLPMNEIDVICGSLAKKEMNFSCKNGTLSRFCNRDGCKGRKHSCYSQGGSSHFPIETISVLMTEPPVFICTLDNGRVVEVMSQDLQSQSFFQRKVMDQLYTYTIKKIKSAEWDEGVARLLEGALTIPVPEEATPVGMLMHHFEQFCTSHNQAKEWNEVVEGKPFMHEGYHYFRMMDLYTFLERKRFKTFTNAQILNIMRKKGIKQKSRMIAMPDKSRKNVSLYIAPMFDSFENLPQDDLDLGTELGDTF